MSKTNFGLEVDESRAPYTILTFKGVFDVHTAPRVRHTLVDLIKAGHRQIVADLEGLKVLDSVGLGVIIVGLRRIRAHDGDITLVCTRPKILQSFQMTGLQEVFKMYRSVEEATAG